MSAAPSVSIGIALYNEEAVLPELLERLGRVIDTLPGSGHQVVLVDDGSADRTWAIIEAAARQDRRFVAISLSRNFGHQAALTAVLEHVTGDVAIIMDGDLQDPPESIPRFLEAHAAGADVVYARRVNRKEGLLLRISYHAFYRLMGSVASVQLPMDAGDFGLLSRRVVQELRRTGSTIATCGACAPGWDSARKASRWSGASGSPATASTARPSCSSSPSTASLPSPSCRFGPPHSSARSRSACPRSSRSTRCMPSSSSTGRPRASRR